MLTKAIAALDKGDPTPIEKMGFEQVLINTICHILHNYSFESRSPLHEVIAVSLSTHAPLRALHRLERFIEAADKRLAIPSTQPELPCILARVFATSGALSGRLIADLTLVHMLEELKTPLTPHFDRKYYLNSITENLKKSNIYSEKVKIAHQVHSIELMRICARNADPETGISEINTELSSLAEATVEACLSVSAEELYARIGSGPCPHSLVVLGLGKLGGQELNVSSDIDLIYLCNDTSEKWAHYDTIHYHTMLAEHLTKLLTEATDLGALYRVDTRLRADGISGPLVRTTKDYFRYLELRGEAWERQMLLKARPVAGDYKVGQQFLDSLNHFIYPTSITRSPNREIVELKNRIEARLTAEGSEKTHLKLMPGGIRDIEFVVQCLQLLTGGIHPEVRNTGTLTGLERLRSVSALSPEEYKILSDAYIIYRKVENALQWRDLLPAFTLPVSAEDMNELASYLQFAPQAQNPASVLSDELERNCKAVRGIYNEIFSAHSNDSFEQMALYAASNPSGSEKVRRFMESLGFNNPIENVRTLSMLAFGDKRGLSPTGLHSSLERFIPKLLRSLSNLPDPSGALERFTRLTESYRARYTLFDVLDSHPSVFELVITITHGSGFITDILVRDPSLLDWLVEAGGMLHPIDTKKIQNELKHIDNENNTDKSFTAACLAIKNREKLRIGVRDITGLGSTYETFSELTTVAECIVKAVFLRAYNAIFTKKLLKCDYAFSIMAAGRLGAGMMDFGSDLDLIFVYKGATNGKSSIEIPEISTKLAQHILSLIIGDGGAGKLYDVDARLRPEGSSSVLAVSIEEYKRYLHQRASVWERLALIRARPLTGNQELGTDIIRSLRNFIYHRPFTRSEVKKIMDIRAAKVENTLKLYPGLINIKSGPGGIFDIDLIAHSYAAHHGAEKPPLQCRETPHILSALAFEKVLDRHVASSLREWYFFLCDVEKSLRMSSGRSINTLPNTETELARVSRLLGFKNIRRFKKRLDDVLSLTKELYDRLMSELFTLAEDDKKQR